MANKHLFGYGELTLSMIVSTGSKTAMIMINEFSDNPKLIELELDDMWEMKTTIEKIISRLENARVD